MQQINLKIPGNLLKAAKRHVDMFGFRNIQELALESMREKIFEKAEYDQSFSDKEIELIDSLISASVKKRDFVSEEELNEVLLE